MSGKKYLVGALCSVIFATATVRGESGDRLHDCRGKNGVC